MKRVFREVFILAKITVNKCEILENSTLELNIEKIIYNLILEEIKNGECVEKIKKRKNIFRGWSKNGFVNKINC